MTTINSTVSSLLNNYLDSQIKDTAKTSTDKTSTDAASSSVKESHTALKRYFDSTDSDKVNAKTIFNKLSIDVGSDGKKITKDQLDSYISKSDKGTINLSDNEKGALKEIQKNWNQISEGSNSISYFNVSSTGYSDTLTSMAPTDTSSSGVSDLKKLTADLTANAYGSVVNAALGSTIGVDGSSTSSLTTMLNSLLKGTTDENDDANANMIATLTNLIAGTTSTVDTKI